MHFYAGRRPAQFLRLNTFKITIVTKPARETATHSSSLMSEVLKSALTIHNYSNKFQSNCPQKMFKERSRLNIVNYVHELQSLLPIILFYPNYGNVTFHVLLLRTHEHDLLFAKDERRVKSETQLFKMKVYYSLQIFNLQDI